jgi:hypothetical protein
MGLALRGEVIRHLIYLAPMRLVHFFLLQQLVFLEPTTMKEGETHRVAAYSRESRVLT